MRLVQIFCFSSAERSPDVAFGAFVFGTADVAAATADDICCHCSCDDSNMDLIASAVGGNTGEVDSEVEAKGAAWIMARGTCGILDGVTWCDGTCVLAMLDSRTGAACLAITSLIITSDASTLGNTTGVRGLPTPFLGPSGIAPYGRLGVGAPPCGGRGVRCDRPRTGDRDRELRMGRPSARSLLTERRERNRDARVGSRSRLPDRRRPGDRRRRSRSALSERWRGG